MRRRVAGVNRRIKAGLLQNASLKCSEALHDYEAARARLERYWRERAERASEVGSNYYLVTRSSPVYITRSGPAERISIS